MNLTLDKVSLAFDKAPLFQDVSFAIRDGDFVVIEGPSGCGKSSLLRLLNRLHEPTEGQLLVDGEPACQQPVTTLRRQVALLQQTPVIAETSVRENLLMPWQVKAAAGQDPPADETLRELLSQFLLDNVRLEDDAQPLSVGQQQRLSLVRLLLMEPSILLADEPTSALDPKSMGIVDEALVRANQERGMGIVLVTHHGFERDDVRLRRFRFTDGGILEVS